MKKLITLFVLLILIVTLSSCKPDTNINTNSYCTEIQGTSLMSCQIVWSSYLYTVVQLTVYVEKDSTTNTIDVFHNVEDILSLYTIISDKYTGYDGTENVFSINETPTVPHVIDEELFDLIAFTLANQTSVDQFYNAALGPVLQIWHDYREDCLNNDVCAVPDIGILQDANQYTDYTKIVMDPETLSITMDTGMNLDLGGVSKGYVSREIIDYLDTLDISGYLLNNGESNISVGGTHPTRDNSKFIIAVTDPTDPYDLSGNNGYVWVYLQDGEQLVTSGDYQKYYTVNDVSYHHIIDPVTLMPLRYIRSVSIITDDPALADLLSTAIFNMSIQDGIDYVDSFDNLEAVWYDIDGNIFFSENFEALHLLEIR